MAADILIVDDEADIRELVAGILEDEGYETRTAGNSDAALQVIADRVPRLIFLDIWLQGSRLDGLDVLDAIRSQHPEVPVVMISGHGNIETAVSAIRRGAYDYIEKPFKADRLVLVAVANPAHNLPLDGGPSLWVTLWCVEAIALVGVMRGPLRYVLFQDYGSRLLVSQAMKRR